MRISLFDGEAPKPHRPKFTAAIFYLPKGVRPTAIISPLWIKLSDGSDIKVEPILVTSSHDLLYAADKLEEVCNP